MKPRTAAVVVVALLASACADGEPAATVAEGPPPASTATTTVPVEPHTSPAPPPAGTSGAVPAAACVPGPGRPGIDLETGRILRLYNAYNDAALVEVIGDGPVLDPSLEPGSPGRYPSVAAWLVAARATGDRLDDRGYGFTEPFQLLVRRRNDGLAAAGIDSVTLTLHMWVRQDCEVRVEAGDEISSPDPCAFARLFQADPQPAGCTAPFAPRAMHGAVWTGEEVLVFGGVAATDSSPPYRSGWGFTPATGEWRELAPAPVVLQPWPVLRALWAGDRMLVVGAEDQTWKLTVLGYDPAADAWSVARAPEGRNTVGAAVWTGSELLLVGGDLNAWDDTAWAYEPAGDRWRQLADPGIPAVEGMEGVWTGAEAIFYGGYGAGPPVAYDPATGGWRRLAAPPQEAPIGHELIWTGDRVVLFSGHVGPSHPNRVLSYDPLADAWEVSEPIPIAPRERLAAAWSADRLLLWGGYATYGEVPRPAADGAAYVPATDSWHVLPPAPLSGRCDHSGTWTGTTFIVFGGLDRCGSPGVLALGDAASYDPASGTWELLAP